MVGLVGISGLAGFGGFRSFLVALIFVFVFVFVGEFGFFGFTFDGGFGAIDEFRDAAAFDGFLVLGGFSSEIFFLDSCWLVKLFGDFGRAKFDIFARDDDFGHRIDFKFDWAFLAEDADGNFFWITRLRQILISDGLNVGIDFAIEHIDDASSISS